MTVEITISCNLEQMNTSHPHFSQIWQHCTSLMRNSKYPDRTASSRKLSDQDPHCLHDSLNFGSESSTYDFLNVYNFLQVV